MNNNGRIWAVYHNELGSATGFGRIKEVGTTCLIIAHSENGPFAPWSFECVKRCKTLEKSVRYFLRNRNDGDYHERVESEEEIWELAKQKFPSYFKNRN